MNINITLLGEMITFALLVFFTMKKVWPPIMEAMQERRKRIAEGLAAAERGAHEQELAKTRVAEQMKQAKREAAEIIAQAQKRATTIVDEAKSEAREEGQRQLQAAQAEIQQESNRAREQLRTEVAKLAVVGAERVLQREVDAKAHNALLKELVAEL